VLTDKFLSISLSTLDHCWFIDIDGTIFFHNGYMHENGDVLLPGVIEFWSLIPINDMIILMTARSKDLEEITKNGLDKFGLRYDQILFGLPKGERILINDKKPSGLKTAIGLNLDRDLGFESLNIIIHDNI
jgi:hypothetical protein